MLTIKKQPRYPSIELLKPFITNVSLLTMYFIYFGSFAEFWKKINDWTFVIPKRLDRFSALKLNDTESPTLTQQKI